MFLAPLLDDGLAVLEGNVLRVPAAGRAFIRNIATFFDEYFSRVAAGVADVFPVDMRELTQSASSCQLPASSVQLPAEDEPTGGWKLETGS